MKTCDECGNFPGEIKCKFNEFCKATYCLACSCDQHSYLYCGSCVELGLCLKCNGYTDYNSESMYYCPNCKICRHCFNKVDKKSICINKCT